MSSGAPDEVRFHLSRESKRRIYSATITSVIFVLTVGQGHAGFLFIVAILPLAVWLGWSAFVIVRRPYARLAQFICILIWAIAISLVTAAHYLRHEITRRDADVIVGRIDRFNSENGYCPTSLDAMGFKLIDVEDKLGANFSYSCVDRKPRFSYVATFTIFDTWDYDFDRDRWGYTSWAKKKKFLETNPPVLGGEAASSSIPSLPQGSRPISRRTP